MMNLTVMGFQQVEQIIRVSGTTLTNIPVEDYIIRD